MKRSMGKVRNKKVSLSFNKNKIRKRID